MSVLGTIVDDALSNLFVFGRRDRKLEKLLAEGERLTGVIDGYRVRNGGGDTADTHWVSVTVQGTSGPFRATVRQQLIPEPHRAPLGTRVTVLHRAGKIAIDWPATLREQGVDVGEHPSVVADKTLKEPLPPGIDDDRIRAKTLERGTPATATVTAVEETVLFGMPTQNKDLHLRFEDGRTVLQKRALIPHYAEALTAVGTRLPVVVDARKPDKVTIDWPTAAEQAAR